MSGIFGAGEVRLGPRGERGAVRGVRRGRRGEGDGARATRRGRCGEGDTAKGGDEGDAAREMWRGRRGEEDVARGMWRGRCGEGDAAKRGDEGDAAGRPGSSIVSRSVNTTAQSSGSAEIPKARRFFLEHFRLAFCVEEMRFAQGAGSGRSERWREGWYKEKGRGRKSGTIKVVQHFQCWSGALWPP